MKTGRGYQDLLEKTKIFGQRQLPELEEEEVASYLAFLGFPEPLSEHRGFAHGARDALFLLLCKVLQDCASLTSGRKGSRKELRLHHLRLFGYLVSNLDNRRKLSVYVPLFLKILDLERGALDLEAYGRRVQGAVYLAQALWGRHSGGTATGPGVALSSNEMNDVVKILLNYLQAFEHLQARRGGSDASGSSHLLEGALLDTLRQILVFLDIIKRGGKAVGAKSLDQLLAFVYHLYKYRRDGRGIARMGETQSGLGVEKDQDRISVVEQVEENVWQVVQNTVKDKVLDLLGVKGSGESGHDVDGTEGPKGEGPKDATDREYGLVLVLPQLSKLIASNFKLTHTILGRVVDFVKESGLSVSCEDEARFRGHLVYLESYYKLVLAMRSTGLLMIYNKDEEVMKMVKETLEFVFEQLERAYGGIRGSAVQLGGASDLLLREQLEYYWGVLVVVCNLSLEFMEASLGRVFRLLYLDFQSFSTPRLERDTRRFLYGIAASSSGTGPSGNFNVVKPLPDKPTERTTTHPVTPSEYLPSCAFLDNLIRQYNEINQMNAFFEYALKYYRSPGVNPEPGGPDSRGAAGAEREASHKRMREEGGPESGPKRRKGGVDQVVERENCGEFQLNFLNNYCVLKVMLGLKMGSAELVRNLRTLGSYEPGLYTLVVGYLSRLELGQRNVLKVAQEFLKFCGSLDVRRDSVGLALMLQVVVTARRLVSFFSPLCHEGRGAGAPGGPDEAERRLLSNLLLLVYRAYEYVRDGLGELLGAEEDDAVVFGILRQLVLVNNERFRVYRPDERADPPQTPESQPDEIQERARMVLSMDVRGVLEELLRRGHVAECVLRGAGLFGGDEGVEEYLLQNRDLGWTLAGHCGSLSRRVSRAYFNRFLELLQEPSSALCDPVGPDWDGGQEGVLPRAKQLLENALGPDNSEIALKITVTVDRLYLQLQGHERRRGLKGGDERANLAKVVLLLELLLQVLDYEFLVYSTGCYRLVLGCEGAEGESACDGTLRANLFDVIVGVRRLMAERSFFGPTQEKRALDVFAGLYYTFTLYIDKYYRPEAGEAGGAQDPLGLTTSLLLNYLEHAGSSNPSRNRAGSIADWNVYFLYRYIKKLRLGGQEACLEAILSGDALVHRVVASHLASGRGKREAQQGGGEEDGEALRILELAHNNPKLAGSKYAASLALQYINANLHTGSHWGLEGGAAGSRLRAVVLGVIEALNSGDRYLDAMFVRKEREEVNVFFKRLLKLGPVLYTQFGAECVAELGRAGAGYKANYLMLVLLVRNLSREELAGQGDLLALVREFVAESHRRMLAPPSNGGARVAGVGATEDIVLNYLMLARLVHLDDVNQMVVQLMRIVYERIRGIVPEGDLGRLTHISLKLPSMLVNSNVNRNLYVVLLFYQQFNQLVLAGLASCRELVRFTNLIVNTNSYKYVKNLAPVALNMAINTLYQLSSRHGDEGTRGEGPTPGPAGPGVGAKEREALRNAIIKCTLVCDDKIRAATYRLIKSSQVRLFFKEQLQRPR